MRVFIAACIRTRARHILSHTSFIYSRGIVQLKDGEESELNGVTFIVELHVRPVFVNGAEQQRCTACTALGVVLFFGGLHVSLVRNDIGHGGCVTCHVALFYDKSIIIAALSCLVQRFPISRHLNFLNFGHLLSTTTFF